MALLGNFVVFRFYCFHSRLLPSTFRHNYVSLNALDNPQLFIHSVTEQCKLGFRTPHIPVSIFHQLYSLRPLPSIIVFNLLFNAMSKIKPHPPSSIIVSFYNQLELSGLRPDCHSIGILANCYCQLGRVDFGFSLLGKRLKLGYPPDVVIITTLLNGLIASNMLPHAIRLLDEIVKLGIQPTIVTYGAMFKGLCNIGDYAGALNLLRDMERQAAIMPNVVIYSTLIVTLCKDRMLPEALGLFNEMKAKGVLPDVVTYNILIQGLCSLGRRDEAKDMLAEMLDSSIEPRVNTYNAFIDMYCKDGNFKEASAIFEFMVKAGVHPDIISYGALLDGYCLRGEMKAAEHLLDVMVKDGVVPDVVTFNCLLNGYCKAKQADKALVMLKKKRLKGTYITPNVVTYSTLIDALCKNNRMQLALYLFEDMKGRGVAPDVVTYNSLLDGLFKSAHIDMAMFLRREMEKAGVAPSLFTYSIIINGLYEAGQPTEAMDVFSDIVAKGLRPNVVTYTIMIKVLCGLELLDDATVLLKEMEDNGCSPNECTYNTIIKGFLNANDVTKALHYLDIMTSQGFAADDNTVFLIANLLSCSNVSDANKALLLKYFYKYHEYMPGGSLYNYLHRNNKNLKLSELLKFAIDVSKGMEYLHHSNIIHRDLKTANLLMDTLQTVKVADFGVARFLHQEGVMTAETGTYRWMAPEVINHDPYDQKTDVFSFGIVLWELATAKVPYENTTPLQAALGVRQGLRPELPENTHPKVLNLMKRCWDTNPVNRPPFSVIRAELEELQLSV